MYSQVLFFSLFSSALLLQALKRRGRHWWVYYTLVSAAGMYTQIFMALALSAQFLWVLLYHRNRLVAYLASGGVVFILFLPWVVFLPWVQRFFQSLAEQAVGVGAPVGSRAPFRAGFSWESIPYTFFVYASGFSVGPTVAELHENRSLGFILQFAPEILCVAVAFGTLFLIGLAALYNCFDGRFAILCLLGLSIPIAGTLLYALTPRGTYNVRYSIVAFPYFCMVLGTGLTYMFQRHRSAGAAFLLGIVAVSSTSLSNHFFNPRYAKEDIRSAVEFWRSDSKVESLLSYRSQHVLAVYLRESERKRHSLLGEDVVSDINLFFAKTEAPSVYILLARDWRKLKETAVMGVYGVAYEQSYPGVKVLKISNPHARRNHIGAL
jgi:hypothetical protein